jgi:hypothetical protein
MIKQNQTVEKEGEQQVKMGWNGEVIKFISLSDML